MLNRLASWLFRLTERPKLVQPKQSSDTAFKPLGFTKAYRQGTLSNEQHIRLLEEVRQYGRAWLRHEASEFIGPYLARTMGKN